MDRFSWGTSVPLGPCFLIRLWESLLGRAISIWSGFRIRGCWNCLRQPAAQHLERPRSMGRCSPCSQGEEASFRGSSSASRKGPPAPVGSLSRPPCVNSWGHFRSLCSPHPNSLEGLHQNVNRRHFVFARFDFVIMVLFYFPPFCICRSFSKVNPLLL